MQIHRPLHRHIEKYRQLAQTLRLWVLDVLARWVGCFGDRDARLHLRKCLRDARSETRAILFLAIMARLSYRTGAPLHRRPPSVRNGFLYAYRRFKPIRLCTRGIALNTLDDIRTVLDDFDRFVARAVARLPKRIIGGRLIAVAPPALAHVQTVFRPEPCAADTS